MGRACPLLVPLRLPLRAGLADAALAAHRLLQLVELAAQRGWLELWSRLLRGAAPASLWNRALSRLLEGQGPLPAPTLDRAFAARGPVVINVHTDPEAGAAIKADPLLRMILFSDLAQRAGLLVLLIGVATAACASSACARSRSAAAARGTPS